MAEGVLAALASVGVGVARSAVACGGAYGGFGALGVPAVYGPGALAADGFLAVSLRCIGGAGEHPEEDDGCAEGARGGRVVIVAALGACGAVAAALAAVCRVSPSSRAVRAAAPAESACSAWVPVARRALVLQGACSR